MCGNMLALRGVWSWFLCGCCLASDIGVPVHDVPFAVPHRKSQSVAASLQVDYLGNIALQNPTARQLQSKESQEHRGDTVGVIINAVGEALPIIDAETVLSDDGEYGEDGEPTAMEQALLDGTIVRHRVKKEADESHAKAISWFARLRDIGNEERIKWMIIGVLGGMFLILLVANFFRHCVFSAPHSASYSQLSEDKAEGPNSKSKKRNVTLPAFAMPPNSSSDEDDTEGEATAADYNKRKSEALSHQRKSRQGAMGIDVSALSAIEVPMTPRKQPLVSRAPARLEVAVTPRPRSTSPAPICGTDGSRMQATPRKYGSHAPDRNNESSPRPGLRQLKSSDAVGERNDFGNNLGVELRGVLETHKKRSETGNSVCLGEDFSGTPRRCSDDRNAMMPFEARFKVVSRTNSMSPRPSSRSPSPQPGYVSSSKLCGLDPTSPFKPTLKRTLSAPLTRYSGGSDGAAIQRTSSPPRIPTRKNITSCRSIPREKVSNTQGESGDSQTSAQGTSGSGSHRIAG